MDVLSEASHWVRLPRQLGGMGKVKGRKEQRKKSVRKRTELEEMANLPKLERLRRMGAMRTHEGMAHKLGRC